MKNFIPAVKVIVDRECDTEPREFESLEDANNFVYRSSYVCPDFGYLKHHFVITYSDGKTFSSRIDHTTGDANLVLQGGDSREASDPYILMNENNFNQLQI